MEDGVGDEDGGWRMEDGGWRMEDGGWRMEDGVGDEDGGWRMEDGGWRIGSILDPPSSFGQFNRLGKEKMGYLLLRAHGAGKVFEEGDGLRGVAGMGKGFREKSAHGWRAGRSGVVFEVMPPPRAGGVPGGARGGDFLGR